jgi:hypothetical protein
MWITMRVPDHPVALRAALVGLVSLNVETMRAVKARGHRIPSVYEAGIRFKRNEARARARELWFRERGNVGLRWVPEPRGREWWQTWVDNLKEGEGDCEDLASHQVAWYIVEAEIPCYADVIPTGPKTYHAIVRWPDGTIEDPSLVLGMPDPRDRIARKAG